jgi:diguanylate cyclase (GGDEF)-like protein
VADPVPRLFGLTQGEQSSLHALASQVQSLLDLRLAIVGSEAKIDEQSALSQALQHRADHDELTRLPHRGLFQKRLREAIAVAERDGSRVALMMIDVDHFKQVNDSLGHDAGDELLCHYANRMCAIMRNTDTVARLGGDEFGILLPGIHLDEEIGMMVESLNDRLQQPMMHKGRLIDCHASIGLAVYPDHATNMEGLLKCSDLALAAAKIRRGCAVGFSPIMSHQFEREARMLSIAREGIAENRMVPYYQPKVDLVSGVLVGFEALVRYQQRNASVLPPETFAHAFADHQLAAAISGQIMARVLDDMRGWIDRGLAFGHVAINACAADFRSDDFAERLLTHVRDRGLPANLIEVEVTEGVFLGRGNEYAARALSLLSNSGIRIGLDDFGAGFASLTHLKQYPVDVLKIDRSFIKGIGKNPDDITIVRALIGLGNSLGIEMVAEGIETAAQADFVTAHGCDVGQGFLYGSAQPGNQVPTMISQFAGKAAA